MTAERIAWFNCFCGISGDMALGALLDAGADLSEVRKILETLPLRGWSLESHPVMRAGLGATKADVRVQDDQVVRTHAHIVGLIEEARLPRRVRERALATFTSLARVESRLHRRPLAQVHFHEVGGQDAIIDIVGVAAALEVLGVDRVFSSPVTLGSGLVRNAHGMLPVPAPAVVELLRGVPTEGSEIRFELTTPTGAALLSTLASGFGPAPAMVAEVSGFGAGERELDGIPNLVQVVVGAAVSKSAASSKGQPVALVEANLDDVTGEVVARAVAALLEAGAHDAWVCAVTMKKGRPGYVLSALADPVLVDQIVGVFRSETGTLGARATFMERWPAARQLDTVEVEKEPIRVKVSPGRIKVEHDDALRAARITGLPLREVLSRAEQAWQRSAERRRQEEDSRPPPGPVA